jgi:hypothetical protein
MLQALRRHPLPMRTRFGHSLVLTYALPTTVLEPLLPPGLALDTYTAPDGTTHGFVAVGIVSTLGLRPAPLPAGLGLDAVLTGYRIFTTFPTPAGRTMRGLYILRSDTQRAAVATAGNLLTRYRYHLARVRLTLDGATLTATVDSRDGGADLTVTADLASRPAPLPPGSPFGTATADPSSRPGPLPPSLPGSPSATATTATTATTADPASRPAPLPPGPPGPPGPPFDAADSSFDAERPFGAGSPSARTCSEGSARRDSLPGTVHHPRKSISESVTRQSRSVGDGAARRFAGPLPYTFDYEVATKSIVVVKAHRTAWTPEPVAVHVTRQTFLERGPFAGTTPVLAQAFHVADLEYGWHRGVRRGLDGSAR